MKLRYPSIIAIAFVALLGVAFAAAPQRVYRAASDFWGSHYTSAQDIAAPSTLPKSKNSGPAERIRHWNEMAVNASGLDHTPVAPGENRVFGEQVGPVRAARAIAIVHIAVFEAMNCVDPKFNSYLGLKAAPDGTSANCAIAQAAHDTLCAMFPSQIATFDGFLNDELKQTPNGRPKRDGIVTGQKCAAAILALRANDGSNYTELRVGTNPGNFVTSNDP